VSVSGWPISNDNNDEKGQRLIEKLLIVIIFPFLVAKKMLTILVEGCDESGSVITSKCHKKQKINGHVHHDYFYLRPFQFHLSILHGPGLFYIEHNSWFHSF